MVTGWRYWAALDSVWRVLNHVREKAPFPDITLGVGDCPSGADLYAFQWAKAYGVSCRRFEANWKDLRKRAGMVRNQFMIDSMQPDLVVAFLHPECRGTVHCRDYARACGYKVFEVWA